MAAIMSAMSLRVRTCEFWISVRSLQLECLDWNGQGEPAWGVWAERLGLTAQELPHRAAAQLFSS